MHKKIIESILQNFSKDIREMSNRIVIIELTVL